MSSRHVMCLQSCAVFALSMLGCAVLMGCGAHASPDMNRAAGDAAAPRDELEPFACDLSGATPEDRDVLERARLAGAFGFPSELDYVRVGRFVSDRKHYTVAERGEPCRTAASPESCRAELAALVSKAHGKPQIFAITSQGDALELLEGEQVLARLGPIATPEHAWLVLMVREGFGGLLCGDAYVSGQRRTADGFELGELRTKSSCRPFERVRAIYGVARDGTTKRIAEPTIELNPDRCMVRGAGGR